MQNTYYNTPQASVFLSVILRLFLFIFLSVFIILLALRAENATSIIQNTDIVWVLEETGISEDIVGRLNELPFHDADINIDDVQDFIKSDAVSGELGKVIDDYARAFAEGNLDHHLTSGDIADIARNLEPEVYELFDHRLSEADYDRFSRALDEAVDFERLRVSSILIETDIVTVTPILSVSVYFVWCVGILCALILFIIFIHHRSRIIDAFRAAGIPVMMSGLFMLILGLLFSLYPFMFGDTAFIIAKFAGGIIYLIMMYGLVFSGAGLFLIAVFLVLNRRTRFDQG